MIGPAPEALRRLVVITGMAGSGKTLAADCFEDMGYYCVDNLPVSLIPRFWDLIRDRTEPIQRAALVVDAREGAFLDHFPRILEGLRKRDVPVQLVFLDCDDDVLKRRFSESRRPHPLARREGSLEQAITEERRSLQELRDIADRIVDTSSLTSHQLRAFLKNAFDPTPAAGMRVQFLSFGFKHGVPAEADLVFDVRFLPNPHFIDELRPLDGRNPRIQEFLFSTEAAPAFEKRLHDFLEYLLPLYQDEGKAYLTVAIGCTGGKHRSVALSERLSSALSSLGLPVTVSHRDLGLE